MKKQYRSALMASIHETAEGLHAVGVMDKRTMREFDELCLTPVRPLKPKEIRALRLREGAADWVAKATSPFHEAPLTHEVALAAVQLSWGRSDPADRFLAATAKVFGLTLATADTKLLGLGDIATLANR